MIKLSRYGLYCGWCIAFLVCGCSASNFDGSTELGKKSILIQAENALSTKDCASAVQSIAPLYNSAYSDNDVRMMTASAYGCYAGVDLFKNMQRILENISSLSTGGLWGVLARLFPSEGAGQDYVVEGASYATDALLAVLQPGAIIMPDYQVNAATAAHPTGYNVGSVLSADRTNEANLFLIFVAMAGIGGIENRYGLPDSTTFHKTVPFDWTTAVKVDSTGCTYVASILNMVDGMLAAPHYISGQLSSSFSLAGTALKTILDKACNVGCLGGTPLAVAAATGDLTFAALDPELKWVDTGCSISAGCSTCPVTLRSGAACKAEVNDAASCAAAGIVNMINYNAIVGWPGGV